MNTIVQIIFPPQFEPFQPYLSMPYIKGLLNINGINGKCVDANVDFYWWLFKEWKKRCIPGSKREEYLHVNIENAIEGLKNISPHLGGYRWAVNVADEYLSAVSPSDVKISLTSLTIGNKFSSEDLQMYLNNPNNIFREYFEYAKNEILGTQGVKYYLFSLVVLDQLGAACAFASEIKKRCPHAKIVFGGPMVSRFYNKLIKISWVNEIVDIIVPGEAYKVLPKIFGIQRLWTGHVTPDFSDIDVERYFSPCLVLPYLIAHGCKWGLCTFCSHHLSYQGYRTSDIANVVEDISKLIEEYGVEYISFCDEYLTITQLEELVTLLKENNINIRWSTFVRAEQKFAEKNFTKKLYEGGARLLMFGFESVSQRILKLMKKGSEYRLYAPILKSCKDAKIAVRIDFMIGFPTETADEVQRTFAFIRNNSRLLDTPFSSYVVACFELREDIPIMQELKEYGIKTVALLRGDLDEQYDFFEDEGLSPEQKHKWRHKIIAYFKKELNAELITPQNKTHQLFFKDVFDRDYFKLPITRIESSQLQDLYGTWNDGVVVTQKDERTLIIMNYATGGILELSSELIYLAHTFKNGSSLYSVFSSCNGCRMSDFIKLIEFLYRNDYLVVWDNHNKHGTINKNIFHSVYGSNDTVYSDSFITS